MPTAAEALSLALEHHRAGRFAEAEQFYAKAIAADPDSAQAHYLFAGFLFEVGKYGPSEEKIRRALALNPRNVDATIDLGLILAAQGRLEEAVASYQTALKLDPSCAAAWIGSANALNNLGRHDEAISCYRSALAIAPNNPKTYNNLGAVLKERGLVDEAAICFRRAIELLPNYAIAHINLATVLQENGLLDEAIACYQRGIELRPEFANAYFNLGIALRARGMPDAAVASYRRAIELEPDYVDAYINLGLVLGEQGHTGQRIAAYERALELQPQRAEIHNNLGTALMQQGQYDRAAACYDRAVELDPSLAYAHSGRSQLSLLWGNFESGWPQYEWRWKTGEMLEREFLRPRWRGEALAGRTVMLYAEQGVGDTIQFVRYAPLVKKLGATVIVECQRQLVKLLTGCVGIDHLIAEGDELPPFDFHSSLLSLPGIFATTLGTIPASVPYLFADQGLAAEWCQKFDAIPGFRIGINWHGREGNREAARRDIPLEFFASLTQIPSVQLISLQKGAGQKELAAIGDKRPILDLGDIDTAHGAFMDTAAIMMNLDLVITSDTSVAHLAGALGVPVWVALPLVPNWRWLLDRSDSPWYPTMRLFRQKSPGDWPSVFAEIRAALHQRLQP